MYKNIHIYIAVALAWSLWKYLLYRFPPETSHRNVVELLLGLTAFVTIPVSLFLARKVCQVAASACKLLGLQRGGCESDTEI